MRRYRIGVSVPTGNGNREVSEEIIELSDELTEESLMMELKDLLYNLFENLGVSSWVEEIEE